MDTAITEKQRNLLINSEIIHDAAYRKLYKHLKRQKRMSIAELRQRPLREIARNFDELMYESRLEWIGDPDTPVRDLGSRYKHRKQYCELCGYAPIRYEYVVVNRINGNRLSIGSECIKEFDNILQAFLKEELRKLKLAPESAPFLTDIDCGGIGTVAAEKRPADWEPVWKPNPAANSGGQLLMGRQPAMTWDEWKEQGPSIRQRRIEQRVDTVFSGMEKATKWMIEKVLYVTERK